MAYNQTLAARIRALMQKTSAFTEREMFGGIGFMLHGNMACGVIGDDLILRTGPDAYEAILARPQTKPFALTGRSMRGWVMVHLSEDDTETALEEWVEMGVDFVNTLPAK